MDADNPILRWIYIATAAIGGAIVSLSFMRWQEMPWQDRGMTIFVGIVFAVFGVPWLVGDLMGVDIAPLRVACGITFFGAVGAPSFIPLILNAIRKRTGLEEPGK
jgi:hypothetical protein